MATPSNHLPLTERQEKILGYIRTSIRRRGYPPTLREIGAEMNIRSTNGVSDHLRALEKKGYLKREDMKSRALVPTHPRNAPLPPLPDNDGWEDDGASRGARKGSAARPEPANVVRVPLLGRVAAGPLTSAVQNVEQQLTMDPSLLRGGGETFALRVRGDSMVDAGIHEGDLLFVRRQDTATRGDIVVALVGDEATVKRFFPEKDHVRLQPENKRLQPIFVRRAELPTFRILGVAVGLFRSVGGVGSKIL
ncbi:MAG: transcriptional repressor LexA [Deltaproteobacteria bacterium]|nr:transcriptional repressor LexA [Deltaproteobacteria bacterium]